MLPLATPLYAILRPWLTEDNQNHYRALRFSAHNSVNGRR